MLQGSMKSATSSAVAAFYPHNFKTASYLLLLKYHGGTEGEQHLNSASSCIVWGRDMQNKRSFGEGAGTSLLCQMQNSRGTGG